MNSNRGLSSDLIRIAGDIHKRQRKVMLPGFGGTCICISLLNFKMLFGLISYVVLAPESRAFVPIFRRVGAEVNLLPTTGTTFSPTIEPTFSSSLPNGRTSLGAHRIKRQF